MNFIFENFQKRVHTCDPSFSGPYYDRSGRPYESLPQKISDKNLRKRGEKQADILPRCGIWKTEKTTGPFSEKYRDSLDADGPRNSRVGFSMSRILQSWIIGI